MKIENHWLTQAHKVPSPNFDDRPIDEPVSLIVVHCISLPPEQFGGNYIDQLFCNQLNPDEHPYFKDIHQLKVSAHLLIKRTGGVTQYVAFNKRAWHAGQSVYNKRQKCNDFSIGIELEGSENQCYTRQQYEMLISVSHSLLDSYPGLSPLQVVGHSDIAAGRKKDPGPYFDWNLYLSSIKNQR